MKIENIDINQIDKEKIVHLEMNYPRNNIIDTIEIGLSEVRASDDIRIKYDFERDGWLILQPKEYYIKLADGSIEYKEEWKESAFCQAWKFEPVELN